MYTKNMSKKYLDSKGLSYLWQKVHDKYIQKQSIPRVENELIYFDTDEGFISNQLLLQDDVLFVNTQEDYDLCTKTDGIETDVLGSWQQFQCNTNNSSESASNGNGKYNKTISPEYGKGVLGNTTGLDHPASGYGWWYNDGANIKNDINSGDFNGYILPFSKNRYSFDTLFGCYSNTQVTSGDQIGFSIVNDKNALPRRVETTDGTYYRNTLYDKVTINAKGFKYPTQSAWVKEDKINNTAKVIFTTSPTTQGTAESFPTVGNDFVVYDIENIQTSEGRKNPIESATTVKISSTHEAIGYLGFLTVVVTNSTGMELAQGVGENYTSGNTGTIYVFGSVFDIKTQKWNSTKIIDGSNSASGDYWKLGKNLVKYNAAYNGNEASKTCIIRCNASYDNGKLEILFGDPVAYTSKDTATFNGSKLSFDFTKKSYSFESYHNADGNPINAIKNDISLSNFTPTVNIDTTTSKQLSNDEFWNLFTGDTKFMYNAYSYEYLYMEVLNMLIDNRVIWVHEDGTNTEYGLNEERKQYVHKGDISTENVLTGSRLAYNPITKKLFYSNGEKIYQVAGGAIVEGTPSDGPVGPIEGIPGEQGSIIYNASTYSNYITNGYESSMRVNDLILDNGESVYSRRGNVYRITDINNDTTGEFETNEIYVETQFNDIPENKRFIIVSKVENKDKSGYTYWALSNARSSSSDCNAIQLSNDDIHEKENIVYLDKNLSNSVDINSLFFKVQRNPVYSGVTYTGKSRIIAVNENYDEENIKNWDCLYFSSASSTNTTRLNTISGTRNAVFEIDTNTGYPHPYLLGTKYSSSDVNAVDGLTKYLGVFDEENAPDSVSKFRCYKNINSSLDEQQLIFLVEDNVAIYNPTSPKVVIETEPVTNLLGSKGEPGKDGDVPYIGNNENWFISGVDTGFKSRGEDGLSSLSYIVATCDEHVIAKYYDENMRIGDMVVDNGEVEEGRRGNMYRIINIIENPDLSKYNAQYPPSNPAVIIDKNRVCNLKGDTINGKYIFISTINSYSFGYQRGIIENIKVRRLYDSEKQFLSENYGVNWEYVNLDNKVQEGLIGNLYSNGVDYIDEISDIKYIDLSIGGTVFNCNSVIIPEDNYSVHEFTYKYLSGVEGTNAFSEGDATLAKGNSSHAEGEWNTASGDYSHTEGEYTAAQGQSSHAEGEDTLAIGDASHAEGSRTLAVGDYSHTEGFDTVAQNAYEHSQGTYNVSNKETDTFGDKNTIFSIGVGISGLDRKNAIEVLQNGDVYINGIGDYDGTNALRESYLTGKIAKPLQDASSSINAIGYIHNSENGAFIEGENHEWLNSTPPYKVHKLNEEEKESLGFYSGSIGISYDYCIDCQDNAILSIIYNEDKVNLQEAQIKSCSGIIGIDGNIILQTQSTGNLNNTIYLKFFNLDLYDENGEQIILDNTEYYFSYPNAGNYSHTEGSGSIGAGSHSHAEGSGSIGMGSASHAEGYTSIASGDHSHAEGSGTKAQGYAAHAEGSCSIGMGSASHAEGSGTKAQGYAAHSEGESTYANNYTSHAEGSGTQANGYASHTEGSGTYTDGDSSHAEGSGTYTKGYASHAEGSRTLAVGDYSHAEGDSTTSQGIASHAEGIYSYTEGDYSHAEGSASIGIGDYSHAEGHLTTSQGIASHAEGSASIGIGNWSHAEGSGTKAQGYAAHAEGSGTIGMGSASHAEGYTSIASGDHSHAEGEGTKAQGLASHTEGSGSIGIGPASHAEGEGTKAQGYASHAEGFGTKAEGVSSHSEGGHSCAKGHYSHTEGIRTITKNEAEHAEGMYNLSNTGTISSIGIGYYTGDLPSSYNEESAVRKNAFEVMQNGDAFIYGVGDYDGTNISATNKNGERLPASIQEVLPKYKKENRSVCFQYNDADGSNNQANADYSFVVGYNNKAHREEPQIQENGDVLIQQAGNSFVGGENCNAHHSNTFVFGQGLVTTNGNQVVLGKYNNPLYWENIRLAVGCGIDNDNKMNLLVLQEGAGLRIRGTCENGTDYIGDFGEYFEWLDGNPDNEDRIGYMVQLNGNKIELATSLKKCIGVISGTCSFLSGSCSLEWHGRFLRDKFGRYLKDENGNLIVNPDYNPELEYIPREQRKEWDVVGLVGQVVTRQDGTLEVGGYAGCNNGIATNATRGFKVLKIIDNETALILVK